MITQTQKRSNPPRNYWLITFLVTVTIGTALNMMGFELFRMPFYLIAFFCAYHAGKHDGKHYA